MLYKSQQYFYHMYCSKIILNRGNNLNEHPCHYFFPVKPSSDSLISRVLTCSMIDDESGYSVIEIIDENDSLPVGLHVKDGGECNIMKVGSSHYMAFVTNRNCLLANIISDARCFLISAVPKSDKLIEWILIGPNKSAIDKLHFNMSEKGYNFEIVASFNVSIKVSLTSKEEKAFNLAMDLGYYDVPKRINLEKISKIFDCSKSTMNVRLRNAEKKIFDFYRIFSFGMNFKK